jgi:two-component system response regulator AtoC
LQKEIEKGNFREDLYYRLNVARLAIPPLRSRMEDLPRLTGFLLEKLNRKMDMHVETLSREAWEKLNAYSFPGNIRELENLLERAMIFAEGDVLSAEELELSDINVTRSQLPEGLNSDSGRTLKEQEKDSILAALHRWEGNRSHAAKELGISRRTIINKIKEYGLDE